MINKTKTIFCVCALTASAFAWNATADENRDYGIYHNNTGPAVYEDGNLLNYLYNEDIGAWYIQYHPT